MAKIEGYRKAIQAVLEKYANLKTAYGETETMIVQDLQNDHYQLMTVGWHKNRRVHGCIFHIDIKNGRIWIQHDGTETGIANELIERGIPKDEIVLAYYPVYRRQHTGFAVA